MDPDLNKYNLHHRVTHHQVMSDREWDDVIHEAWAAFFSDEHMETVARRHAARANGRPKKAAQYMNEFRLLYENEDMHPLEAGIVRRKRRRSRRSGLPLEPAILFYPRFALETVRKAWRFWRGLRRQKALVRRVVEAPDRYAYSDVAIRPLTDSELAELGLFNDTAGGEAAVARQRRQEARIEAVQAAHEHAA